MNIIKTHEDLVVFQRSIDAATNVFEVCKTLPSSEKYEMVTQWLRCSRSTAANLAEAWRKRYYRPHFLSKLSDVEAEAAECQVWALLCYRCGYIDHRLSVAIRKDYDRILSQVVMMSMHADKWTVRRR